MRGPLQKLILPILIVTTLISSRAMAMGGSRTFAMGKHPAACGPIHLVQAIPGWYGYGAGMSSTVAAPGDPAYGFGYGSPVSESLSETAGNLLVAAVFALGEVVPNEVASVSDTLGNTWYQGAMYTNAGTDQSSVLQIWYAPNVAGGANTVYATVAGNGATISETGLFVSEYAGVATSDVVDISVGQVAPSSTLDIYAGPLTTSTACDLIVAAFDDGNGNWQYGGGIGGWQQRNWNGGPSAAEIDNLPTGANANTTVNPGFVAEGTADNGWVATAMAFRASNTSPLPQPTQLAFLVNPSSQSTWTCTAQTVQSQNSSSQPTNTATGITVNLSGSNLEFFADANCQYPISSVLIGAGTNSQSFYFMSSSQGSPVLSASSSGYTTLNQTESVNAANGFTWIGSAGGTACTSSPDWSNGACWSGGIQPSTGQVAIFDSTCTGTCNPTLTSSISVGGILLGTGTLTTLNQGSYSITVNSFTQQGGVFDSTASTKRLTVDGPFLLSGGTFNAPSGSATHAGLTVNGIFSQSGGTFNGGSATITNLESVVLSGGTFNTPSGTLNVGTSWNVSGSPTYNVTAGSIMQFGVGSTGGTENAVINPGSLVYGNVTFGQECNYYDLGGGTMTVSGTLTVGGTGNGCSGNFDNGTINLSGNLVGAGDQTGYYGTAKIVLVGNASGQTVFGNGDPLPIVAINAGSNPVTLDGAVNVMGFNMMSVGPLTTAASTLTFYCPYWQVGCWGQVPDYPTVLYLGNQTYNNITIEGFATDLDLGGATTTMTGNLMLGDQFGGQFLNDGTFYVAGNVTAVQNGYGGSVNIALTGNAGGQTINGGGLQFPNVEIEAGSDTVTLNGVVNVSGYDYVSGTMVTTGSTLNFSCMVGANGVTDPSCNGVTVNFSPGTVVYNNAGFYGFGSTVNLGGAMMTVAGNLTIGDYCGWCADTINNGTINLSGNLSVANSGDGGNANIVLVGNSSGQTVTGNSTPPVDEFGNYASGAQLPTLTLATDTNPVTLGGNIWLMGYQVITATAVTTTGSTISYFCGAYNKYCSNNSATFLPGSSIVYNNIEMVGSATDFDLGGDTVQVAGNLTFGDDNWNTWTINDGTFIVQGGLQVNFFGNAGNAQIQFTGSNAQTINVVNPWGGPPSLPTGNVVVNASGGSVTLQSNVIWTGSGQPLTLQAGTFDMAGDAMTVPGALTIDAGATLNRQGGALTYGSLVNNGTLNP